jgi:putative peptide zinc metalloprotease protein
VLTPSSGSAGSGGTGGSRGGDGGAPTWVFPFNRPAPPGQGDNQALAVNTTDGSVKYDVSFALVWVDGNTALNRNEAYAFASCSGCTTVAVAFQVVLLVGSVHVVVPQNIAAAANYACLDCVTYALATQLVVSLPGRLDAAGTQKLDDIWAQLQDFAKNIDGVPLSELRARLTDFESQILGVVQQAGGTTTGTDAGTTASTAPVATDGSGGTTAPGGAAATNGAPASTAATGQPAPATTDSPTPAAPPPSTEPAPTTSEPAATTSATPTA